MSFTVKVKEELINQSRFDKSELSAVIKMSGSLGLNGQSNVGKRLWIPRGP